MTEVGRRWHFAAHKVWWKNRGETIQRPIFLYFLTMNSFFALRKRVRAGKVEDFRMKNWIEYEENSSSDARRGHLRTSKFPNFSKGESFPLWPLQSLRRRRWFSFVGDSRPPTRPFFHYLPGLCWIVAERECGVVNLKVFLFIIWKITLIQAIQMLFISYWKLSRTPASVSNIYISTRTAAHPMVPHCGTHLKQYLKHEGGIVEKTFTHQFSLFFDEESDFRT